GRQLQMRTAVFFCKEKINVERLFRVPREHFVKLIAPWTARHILAKKTCEFSNRKLSGKNCKEAFFFHWALPIRPHAFAIGTLQKAPRKSIFINMAAGNKKNVQ
ncbi:MAG: hypothetical protein II077_11995, partial [Treponema sp.]|nr:hypothetical protein [Treponema sp.]